MLVRITSHQILALRPLELPRIQAAPTAAPSIPNTGMVITNDIANLRDIHRANRRDVGLRLARWALARTYGRDGIVVSGPLFESMHPEGGKLRLRFALSDGGLVSRDGKELSWFEVRGLDGAYVAANATVDGDSVLVWSEAVAKPVGVRFAWHMEAVPNLGNGAGLPASAFSTDFR